MKKHIFYILACTTLFFVSCNDELDTIGEYTPTAIVHSILNESDSTHFIKVNRAFIGDGNTSALDLAQNPDSNYFESVKITLKEVVNGITERTFSTEATDPSLLIKDTIIENKDESGVFYAPEQKLYVFHTAPGGETGSLRFDAEYHLTIDAENGKVVVKSAIELIGESLSLGVLANANRSLKFSNLQGDYINQPLAVSGMEDAYLLHTALRFDYAETVDGSTYTYHDFTWNVSEKKIDPTNLTAPSYTYSNNEINGEQFYTMVDNKIQPDASLARRLLRGIQIKITIGDEVLSNYMDVNAPSSTLAQNKPEYTNLEVNEGANVVGIFASRKTLTMHKRVTSIDIVGESPALDKYSMQKLCIGPLTYELSFCAQYSPWQDESWYCF